MFCLVFCFFWEVGGLFKYSQQLVLISVSISQSSHKSHPDVNLSPQISSVRLPALLTRSHLRRPLQRHRQMDKQAMCVQLHVAVDSWGAEVQPNDGLCRGAKSDTSETPEDISVSHAQDDETCRHKFQQALSWTPKTKNAHVY